MSNGSGHNIGETGREFNINVTWMWEQQNGWGAVMLDWVLKTFKIASFYESWCI